MSSERNSKGVFVKGHKPISVGRISKKRKQEADRQKILNGLYAEANGDSMKLYELLLQNAHKLELKLNMVLKIMRDLTPYKEARKASVEMKTDAVTSFNIVYQSSETPIKVIDHDK